MNRYLGHDVMIGSVHADDLARDLWCAGEVERWIVDARERGGRRFGIGRASSRLREQLRRRERVRVSLGSVPPERWDTVARAVTDDVVRRVRAAGHSHRHAYHGEILEELDDVVPLVLGHVGQVIIEGHRLGFGGTRIVGAPVRWPRVEAVPQIHGRIDADSVTGHIRDRVAYYRAIADDPVLLTAWGQLRGQDALIVQHQASGMRAAFAPGRGGIGEVYSKSYRIGSIDARDEGKVAGGSVEYLYGLGIGEVLYRYAAEQLPPERWRQGTVSSSARRLRRRLHALDPYVWDGECRWCQERGIFDWERASRADLAGHP